MKELKTYVVTLHDERKRHIYKRVVACVSAAAACRVANLKFSFDQYGRWRWDATDAYRVI